MIKYRVITPVRTTPPRDFNSLEEIQDWYEAEEGYVLDGLDILYPIDGWLMPVARIYVLDIDELERSGDTFTHEC